MIVNFVARELFEDFGAVTLKSRVVTHPERRRSRERQNMRQEVSRGIHDMNLAFTVGNSDMHVYAEDQERPRDGLQLLNQQLVSLVIEDLLILPTRARLRRSCDDLQRSLFGRR